MSAATEFISATVDTLHKQKQTVDGAVAQTSDANLRAALSDDTNSIAVIMKHVAGNLISRWTDFLTTDGEKPWRDRDDEFRDTFTSRAELLDYWDRGWQCMSDALAGLTAADLSRTVQIRGEPHSVPLAISRSLGHTCYHAGQIVQIARVHAGENWQTLSIPRGGSQDYNRVNWGPGSRPPE